MPDSHYIGSPEDSGEWPVLREPRETKGRSLARRALWFAVMYAVIAGAVLLVAMLAGCATAGRADVRERGRPIRLMHFEIRLESGTVISDVKTWSYEDENKPDTSADHPVRR
jgi:hypothetical protein